MKRKICMIVPSFTAKGGITSVVSGYTESSIVTDYDLKFIETYCDGGKVQKIVYALIGFVKFVWLVLIWKPEIVHVHSSFGASFYRKRPFIIFAKKHGIPIINHVHGADFDEFYVNAGNKRKRIIQKTYNSCDKLIALSEEWKEKLVEIVPEKKIVIIENYSIICDKALAQKDNKKNNHQVLFLGFLCKRKGCYDIPAVVSIVKESIPDVSFILAGSGEKDELQKVIDNEIKENIIFPGWIRNEEKDKYLMDSDLFYLPSYNEGMPMSILDAMGYGLPIVSTNVGGIPKIVRNGINGYLFNPGDVKGMASAICNLLVNDEQRKQMGYQSIRIVKNGYSITDHINKIEKIYSELLLNYKR